MPTNKANGDSLWLVTIDISMVGIQGESVLSISTPYETEYSQLIKQTLTHPGLKIRTTKRKDGTIRGITGIAKKDGNIDATVEYMIQHSSTPSIIIKKPTLASKIKERYLKDEAWLDISNPTLVKLANHINAQVENRNDLVKHIYKYTNNLKTTKSSHLRAIHNIVESKHVSVLERSILFISLARSLQFPARLVTGFILKEPTYSPHYWVEIYLDDNWVSYDPFYGYAENIPDNYVPFHFNEPDVIQLTNGRLVKLDYHIEQQPETLEHSNIGNKNWITLFDLTRLDIETREHLAILLLLPLGVVITTIFRHFIGIHSYGVFTPTLLALAITYNDWLTSLFTFSVVIIFSSMGRRLFPKQLARTPRLSIIFTLVAMSMALGVSIIDFAFPQADGYIVLLPIVILTSLIDNFYKTMEDKGIRLANISLFWTFIIALANLPIIAYAPLGHVFVQYPELHLLTLAGILMITSYQGSKLTAYIPVRLKQRLIIFSDIENNKGPGKKL
ncbi:MAG: 7TM domain-containing protein [Gammaproteobacteria bacterium]